MKKYIFCILVLLISLGTASAEPGVKVGTWKTAQTIQPFYYQQYLSQSWAPADAARPPCSS